MIKRFLGITTVVLALSFAGTASAALMDPGDTGVISNTSEAFFNNPLNSAVLDPFAEEYMFTVTTDTWIRMIYDSIPQAGEDGPVGSVGVVDLTFTWDSADGDWINADDNFLIVPVTDSDGGFAAGVAGVPIIFSLFFNAGNYILTATGEQLAGGGGSYTFELQAVPLPAAALLFGSALLGGGLMRRRKMIKKFGLPA